MREMLSKLAIECWHHLGDQQLERCQVWKPTALKHKVIDAEIDELLHLLYQLSRSADEGPLSPVVVGVEFFYGSFCPPTHTTHNPRSAPRFPDPPQFHTSPFQPFQL